MSQGTTEGKASRGDSNGGVPRLERGWDDWASASLVLNGTDSVLVRTGEDLVDVVRQGQGVLNIVSLGQVVDELEANIHDLGAAAPEDAPARAAHPAGSSSSAAEGG